MNLYNLSEIEDLFWIQTSFLGDIVISTGAFHLVKRNNPKIRQHLITTAIGAAALKGHPDLDSIMVFQKSGLAIGGMKSLRRQVRDLVKAAPEKAVLLQPHKSFRSTILSKVLSVPTITYRETSLGILADKTVSRLAVLHEASRVALLLEPSRYNSEEVMRAKPVLTAYKPESLKPWQEKLEEHSGKIIAIAPGESWLQKNGH